MSAFCHSQTSYGKYMQIYEASLILNQTIGRSSLVLSVLSGNNSERFQTGNIPSSGDASGGATEPWHKPLVKSYRSKCITGRGEIKFSISTAAQSLDPTIGLVLEWVVPFHYNRDI